MYDYWQRAYYDRLEPDEVFPSEELLDDIHVHDSVRRESVSKALQTFCHDFTSEMIACGAIETVLIAGYNLVQLNETSLVFSHNTT